MKKLFLVVSAACLLIACHSTPAGADKATTETASMVKDTLTYPYTATYTSDVTVTSHPDYAQKVLTVWRMFEHNDIDAMKPYFADTITYEDASGMRYHGATAGLLAFAKKDIEGLDSLRFDISRWESVHSNDKHTDWVSIWCLERRYSKKGKADTIRMHENWMVKDGKVVSFDQYTARLPK